MVDFENWLGRIVAWMERIVAGVPRCAAIQFCRRPHSRDGLVVEVPLGRCPRIPGVEVRLSDRFGPEEVWRVVRFVARCDLPVRAWRIHGIDGRPWSCDEAARWIVGLAGAASADTSIVIVTADMPPSWRRRLEARVAARAQPRSRSGSPSRHSGRAA